MRLFFLGYAYEPGLTADAGGFRKLWELAWALRARGHDVLVFFPRLPGRRPLRAVPARAYPSLDLPLLRPLTAHASLLAAAWAAGRRARPDVIYFRSGVNVLPLLLRRLLGARTVLEVNADVQEFLRVEGAGRLRRALARAAEALGARGSDLVVALTPGLKAMLVERHGVPAAKVRVVPSGTDPAHFAPAPAEAARRRVGLPADRRVVGFIGLFYRHQGVPTLLEALARLRASVPDLAGLVVGDGAMRAAWEALARRLDVADLARFTGQVPYAEAPAYLCAMDVAVAPFTAGRGETSPFKVLDALACGRPVVASDLPSVRALADASGGAVVLVPPDDPAALADALGALLADPARRAALGRRGREFVLAHHTWDRIAERLLRELGAGPGQGA
ncbi:MAG: hypothetical protein A3I14_01855 [Candidatus Rokubacteria bacterium RIFCSPLOWO2_02_FULL_73_56]|nr:MAG: hypothetical protein A3D33_04440 [Candidatus Rokubacteria bacterium RIFCSPHIGHO2_02_FULL_73_26]OGL12227.1 MAG: hypothetical protein A3I14_01855 [Candidatus Rokubacteria bacterium RIFCSPLOWO2_02_FULL_73_56]OGL25633.1 MAG: hypothetical protein A3G44_03045 [Candidatus Rokubacteria bacterium RIFCSPLOWO2_12_FULL_73_47]